MLNNGCTWWPKSDKYKLLQDILRDEPIEKVMIFANRRDQVRKLYDDLKRDGYKVVMLSGEIAQDKTFENARSI